MPILIELKDAHHTFICWDVAKLGNKPDTFELALKYDNKAFFPMHTSCSMDVRDDNINTEIFLRYYIGQYCCVELWRYSVSVFI